MELWAQSQISLNNANENTDVELPLRIIFGNRTIPIIKVEVHKGKDSVVDITQGTRQSIPKNSERMRAILEDLKMENSPLNGNF
jgi:hypothetical protein